MDARIRYILVLGALLLSGLEMREKAAARVDVSVSASVRLSREVAERIKEQTMPSTRVLLGVLSLWAMSMMALADEAPDYRANLSGTTVPMTVNTQARGEALFWISEDRQSVRYRLSVADMENVTMAHLQLGKVDTTGPVVVWLYPERPPPKLVRGMFTGVLAEGSIEAGDLLGPLQGRLPADLIAQLEVGNAYVNVHSNRYHEGEIRGQVE